MNTRIHAGIKAPVTGIDTPTRLPFGDGNAASQWFPAMTAANDYARSKGYQRLESRASGELARSFPPVVQANELQTIILVLKDGRRQDLGTVMPEGAHMRELKPTSELLGELKALIDTFAKR